MGSFRNLSDDSCCRGPKKIGHASFLTEKMQEGNIINFSVLSVKARNLLEAKKQQVSSCTTATFCLGHVLDKAGRISTPWDD